MPLSACQSISECITDLEHYFYMHHVLGEPKWNHSLFIEFRRMNANQKTALLSEYHDSETRHAQKTK